MIGRTLEELVVGDVAELSRVATPADIGRYVGAVGDHNPIHSDPLFAAQTSFREPIAPGLWTAGLIAGLLGTQLPGPGTIYISQDLKFLKPVKIGDTVTARVEIVEVLPARNRVRLKTTCLNQRGEEVLSGEAWVLPPKFPVHYRADRPAIDVLSLWVFQPAAFAAQIFSFWWMLGASALVSSGAPKPGIQVKRAPRSLH